MVNGSTVFADRSEAGRKLAEKLADIESENKVAIGLPRGGIPVAAEVARCLNIPLDVIVLKKLGAPGNPELACGAIAESGQVHLNENVISNYGIDTDYLEKIKGRKMEEIKKQSKEYRQARERIPLEGKTVFLIDDGVATGATIKTAAKTIRAEKPEKLIIAVPVAPAETIPELEELADEVYCLYTEKRFFGGVGAYYEDFSQTPTQKVVELLKQEKD